MIRTWSPWVWATIKVLYKCTYLYLLPSCAALFVVLLLKTHVFKVLACTASWLCSWVVLMWFAVCSRCATIHSLAFSVDSAFLACSSNTETVHIFRLDAPSSPKEKYAYCLVVHWHRCQSFPGTGSVATAMDFTGCIEVCWRGTSRFLTEWTLYTNYGC